MTSITTIETVGARRTAGAPRPARPAMVATVAIATTYVSLATTDIKVGGLPLKLFAVAAAIAVWLHASRPWTRGLSAWRFWLPVLLAAVVVPAVWFLVAAWLEHQHDPAQRHGLSGAVQEASRFVYLLLYFPLADREWLGAGWDRLWRWPALLLCGVTIGFFIGHLLGADYGQSGTVGPFQGAIAVDATGTFRAFLVNDVLFLGLFAWQAAATIRDGLSARRLAGLAVTLFAVYLAHTRGLWLGICVIAAVLVVAALPRERAPRAWRATWMLLVVICLGGLIVSADPSLSHRVVALVTGHNEYSTAERLAQAPQLLHGARRDPVLGSGLGATLPSGFVRDPAVPWSFELTYLQLLFQVGLVGLILTLAPVVGGLGAIARSLRGSGLRERPLGFAMAAALAGFLITAAGNPYLLTSVGTFAVAVMLAVVDRELAEPNFGPLSAPAAARGASRRRESWRWQPLPIAAGLGVAVAVLTLLEFVRTHQALPAALQPAPGFTQIGPDASVRPLRLGPGVAARLRDAVAIESSAGAPDTLWAFGTRAARLTATPLAVQGGRVTAGATLFLGAAPPASKYAVATWGGRPAAFALQPRGNAISVTVIALAHRPRVLLHARTPRVPAPAGAYRDLAVATAGGTEPSLFVVDRDPDGHTAIHGFSGASGFRSVTVADVVRHQSAFAPTKWRLAVGPAQSAGADLVMVGTDFPGPGAQLQLHVLLARSGYRRFGVETKLRLPAAPLRSLTVTVPSRHTLYMIDVASGTIDLLRYG